jgi:hypothetical protein
MKIKDFQNPSIPFKEILNQVAVGYLFRARDDGLKLLDELVACIVNMSESEIQEFPDDFIDEVKRKIRLCFIEKAQSLHPKILECIPELRRSWLEDLDEKVCCEVKKQKLARAGALFPEVVVRVANTVTEAKQAEIEQIPEENLNFFSFSDLTAASVEELEIRAIQQADALDPSLRQQPGFAKSLKECQSGMVKIINNLERERKGKYNKAQQEQSKREREGIVAEIGRMANELNRANNEIQRQRKKNDEEVEKLKKRIKELEDGPCSVS